MDKAEIAIEKAKKRSLAKKNADKKRAEFERCAAQVFATPEGKRVLLWLMNECGFLSSNIKTVSASGQISLRNMIWNEARRDLYLRIRDLLKTRPDVLEAVEVKKLGGLNGNED